MWWRQSSLVYYAERAVSNSFSAPISSDFAKSLDNPSSALISVAVVLKPWFEAEKMFPLSFFSEINNLYQAEVFLNWTRHPFTAFAIVLLPISFKFVK